MNVPLVTVAVAKPVPTQWDHFCVAAALAMCLPVVEELAKTSMSVLLTVITASSAASTQQGDSDVNVTQDSDSTLINGRVLVTNFLFIHQSLLSYEVLCICRHQ